MTSNQDYTTTISVTQTPEEAFKAINNVRGWWEGQIEGRTDKVGDVFTYRYDNFHRSKQKVTELVPGKKVVWLIVEGGPKFTKDKTEWKGTKIIFDISRTGGKTEVRFTHQGLVPRLECYDSCTDAWGPLVRDGLRKLITLREGL
ncbi:MAG: SRPBCC domain-containing protein [Nitrososphaerota archaeon]|nr:SRPBCC domain-containing protein [Nitrososphaerota archaeon]